MSLVGRAAKNHPQQVAVRGALSHVDDLATSPDDFARFDERFHFTIDVAASAENTKCERFYDIEQNGLEQSWAGERVWCNPPYSSIEPWVSKAWSESLEAELIVMLLPANRVEQGWWQRLVEPHRIGGIQWHRAWISTDNREGMIQVEFLPGRLRFIKPGSSDVGPNERPPFGCCLLVWNWHSDPLRWPDPANVPPHLRLALWRDQLGLTQPRPPSVSSS